MESIISIISLLIGGGSLGGLLVWRYTKRKAKAEAENAEVDTVKNMQEAYDKMFEQVNHYIEDATEKMADIRSDRDRYKSERDELRERFEKLEDSLRKMRNEYQSEKEETDRKIAQLGRRVEAMRPFLCGDMLCKKRQRVAALEDADAEPPTTTEKPRKKKATVSTDPSDLPIEQKDM